MLSFRSSAGRHPIVTICFSLASLIIVHAVVIAGHEYVNHTNPEQTILYKVDAGLENLEVALANMKGIEAYSKLQSAHLLERMEEIEHVIEADVDQQYIPTLLDKIQATSTITLEHIKENQTPSTPTEVQQIMLVEFESTISELIKRLGLIKESIAFPNATEAAELTIQALHTIDDELELKLADLNVQLEQETVIEKTIEYVPVIVNSSSVNPETPVVDTPTESPPSSCSNQGETCGEISDCCIQEPKLYCRMTTGTGPVKRCLPSSL